MPKLVRRELVTLEEDMDFQGFNNRAVEYGRTLNQKQLLDEAIFNRSQIVSQLKKLPEDALITDVPVTSFTLSSFLQNMFVSHDKHHRKQIEEYLGHFVEIRLLTKDDAIEYCNIRLRALREEPSAFSAAYQEEAHKPIEDIVNRFREQWSLQENYILGAFKDGMLIGMVGFVREHRKKLIHKGNIWGMYVVPEARGEGTGKLLLTELVRRCHNLQGLEQILLTVTSNNISAKRLYENIGFRCYGVAERALRLDQIYFDDDLMVLPI